MSTLKVFSRVGAPVVYGVHKMVTSLGKASGNDLVVTGEGVADYHVQVVFDGRDFNLAEVDRQADIKINGKRKRRARLVNGDRIELSLDLPLRLIPLDSTHPNLVALAQGPVVLFAILPAPQTLTRQQLLSATRASSTEWRINTGSQPVRMLPFTSITTEHYRLYHQI